MRPDIPYHFLASGGSGRDQGRQEQVAGPLRERVEILLGKVRANRAIKV
jgi:hypothetical protein